MIGWRRMVMVMILTDKHHPSPPHHPPSSCADRSTTIATGLQGSGCLRDLKASGRFRLRTVTRNAKSAAAQALAADGVEVLQGNLLDRPFLDRAMAGVGALFLATFSDHDGTEVGGVDLIICMVECQKLVDR